MYKTQHYIIYMYMYINRLFIVIMDECHVSAIYLFCVMNI